MLWTHASIFFCGGRGALTHGYNQQKQKEQERNGLSSLPVLEVSFQNYTSLQTTWNMMIDCNIRHGCTAFIKHKLVQCHFIISSQIGSVSFFFRFAFFVIKCFVLFLLFHCRNWQSHFVKAMLHCSFLVPQLANCTLLKDANHCFYSFIISK